ncbi:MAG: fatty acid--CoA ligase family protein, partial [Chloroflexota bacterium]|nr:fatty acid--CoA ligase family protein [Chloroflexota bacterium]
IFTVDGMADAAFPALSPLPLTLPGSPTIASRVEAMRRSADGTADAAFSLFLTSGTTGATPKLVCQPHRTMTWRHHQPDWWAAADQVVYRLHGAFFQPRPLAEIFCYGATMFLSRPKDPAQMEAEMVACGATAILTNVPTARLLAEQATSPPPGLAIRVVRTGAMALPAPIRHAAAQRYGAAVLEEYASTEGGQMLGTPRAGAPDGSIGIPNPGVGARIVDEHGTDVPEGEMGELIVQSPGLMLGYLDDTEATVATLRDGWLWTGDLARRDADGYYFLEGRRALRINVGGHKVAPEAVEAVLAPHPAVREVVVLAAPNRLRGEVVRAIIVPRGEQPTVAELRRFCRARLATYQVPRIWEFRDTLPRSPLGKVLRRLL